MYRSARRNGPFYKSEARCYVQVHAQPPPEKNEASARKRSSPGEARSPHLSQNAIRFFRLSYDSVRSQMEAL